MMISENILTDKQQNIQPAFFHYHFLSPGQDMLPPCPDFYIILNNRRGLNRGKGLEIKGHAYF